MTSGVYIKTDIHRKHLSEALKGKLHTIEYKNRKSEFMKDLWKNPQYRLKNKTSKGYFHTQKYKKYMSKINKNKKLSEETKRKIGLSNSISLKGRKLSKQHRKNILKRREKSSLELKFEEIVKRLKFPYKFVGNGKFFIERKCPDFINTNGKKIAIEVFWRGFKTKKCFHNNNLEEWKKQRQEIFSKYGWEIEFFDETQVNEEEIRRRL